MKHFAIESLLGRGCVSTFQITHGKGRKYRTHHARIYGHLFFAAETRSKYYMSHFLEYAFAVRTFDCDHPFGARGVGCSIGDSGRCPDIEVKGGGVGFEPVGKLKSRRIDRPCWRETAVLGR
jgi:hypothetical protein